MHHIRHIIGQEDPFCPQTNVLRLYVHSVEVRTAADAPIVTLQGVLRGQLDARTLQRLYSCVPGTSALFYALLDRDVVFPTTATLYFALDGRLVHTQDETDYTSVLSAIGCFNTVQGWNELVSVLEDTTKRKQSTPTSRWLCVMPPDDHKRRKRRREISTVDVTTALKRKTVDRSRWTP